MILAAIALLTFRHREQKVDTFTLKLYQQTFIARNHKLVYRVPVVAITTPPITSVLFRRENTYAVWDERGLTVRSGSSVHSSRLQDIAVSPKAFSRLEILETVARIKQHRRSREAVALSGHRRVGASAYFLVRWDESDGTPWAEALVSVDLTSPKPEPKFVGRFKGRSLATRPIEDRLMLVGGKLAILGKEDKTWSLDTYDPSSGMFASDHIGDELSSFAEDGPRTGVFVERSPYGSVRAGTVDLIDEEKLCFAESSGFMRFLDARHPTILVTRGASGVEAINADTGAVSILPPQPGIARMGPYLLVWGPKDAPEHATLFDPQRWDAIAQWPVP